MTVCGFANGFVWAELLEGYIGNRAVPEPIQKLVVTGGNLVGVGHGHKTLVDAFMSVLAGLGRASLESAMTSSAAAASARASSRWRRPRRDLRGLRRSWRRHVRPASRIRASGVRFVGVSAYRSSPAGNRSGRLAQFAQI